MDFVKIILRSWSVMGAFMVSEYVSLTQVIGISIS